MKRLVAQLQQSKRDDYDPEERGEVTAVGEHHGGSFRTYFAHKVTKLREQHQPNVSGDSGTQIFRGCIMYVNGLTELPIEELRRLISLHGGEHIMYRAVKITHYVCNHFTDAQLKLEHAKVKLNAKNKVHNVTVAWVLDSIHQMKRLNENLYIPKGLKDHGSVLTKSFLSASSSSSLNNEACSSSHSYSNSSSSSSRSKSELVEDLSKRCGAPTKQQQQQQQQSHSNVNLTHSQENFLDSIPAEFREEALLQLEREKKDTFVVMSTNYTTENENIIDLYTPPGPIDLSTADPISVTDDELTVYRRNSLNRMVECIHYDEYGEQCTSKAVMYRIKEYIQTLINTTELEIADTDINNTLPMLQYLIYDYVGYLRSNHQHDKILFVLAELKRACHAADQNHTQETTNNSTDNEIDRSKRQKTRRNSQWINLYELAAERFDVVPSSIS